MYYFSHTVLKLIIIIIQVFPQNLEDRDYNHDTERSTCSYRSELERRSSYFQLLESSSFFSECRSTVEIIQRCLNNDPSKRPIAYELIKEFPTSANIMDEVGNWHKKVTTQVSQPHRRGITMHIIDIGRNLYMP